MPPQWENNILDSATDSLAPPAVKTFSSDEFPLLKQRLIDAGVSADVISFCEDDPDLKQRFEGLTVDDDNKINKDNRKKDNTTIIEIKTLVWEVNVKSRVEEEEKDDIFYVVVAVPLEEKVNENLLRTLIQKELNLSDLCEFFLKLAPKVIAEELTGFTSGCMPPICHTSCMRLFVDSSITAVNENNSSEEVITSIGSGILGQSLLLPLRDFLEVAINTSGVHIGSLTNPPPKPGTPQARREALKKERVRGQPKPKDRLKEYRHAKTIIDKAKILRTAVRKKGRCYNEIKTIIDEAVATGEFPHLFRINTEEGLSKNAMHICAWRGDFEVVKLLVETSRQYNLDIVNCISESFRNYGKTPIFYALTQCREDVVRYLVDEADASLLFVNNKGQTPCSIAVSHLSEEACQYLYDIERRELERGGTFRDYRRSHSDEKFYGDLDPRFPIDNFNYGDDLEEPLKQFHESVEQADSASIINSVPTDFAPRSLRPTVRWWNREDALLENSNEEEGKLLVDAPPRYQSSKTRAEERRRKKRAASPELSQIPEEIDINTLELLTVESVLTKDKTGRMPIAFVNCSQTLKELENAIDASIISSASAEDAKTDTALLNSTWGLDCEWKPGTEFGKDNPVATLQLSNQGQSFLVDLQSLCQSTYMDETPYLVKLTAIEEQLNNTLSKLFGEPNLPILGFSIMQDLGKLAASFPHLSCFASHLSVIDVQSVSSVLYPKNLKPRMSSLQKMVAFLISKRLDKTQQQSDWTQRPLSKDQIDYAVLDAAILPLLLRKIIENNIMLERYNGQFFAVHSALTSNLRYTFLEDSLLESLKDDHKWVWDVPMGTIRSTLLPGKEMARQCWPSNQAPPPLPRSTAVNPNIKTMTKKERLHLAKVGTGKKPKPIQLNTIAGNLRNLPTPGITLGYTKDSCVERVLGHQFMNTLPERTHIGFNRRSGVIETNNSWLLFCNFGMNLDKSLHSGKHPSEFSNGGQFLSFNLKPNRQNGRTSEKTLLEYIISCDRLENDDEQTPSKAILLFARGGVFKQYIYCGSCDCEEHIAQVTDSVDILLRLRDYEELVSDTKLSNFTELVKWREEVCC